MSPFESMDAELLRHLQQGKAEPDEWPAIAETLGRWAKQLRDASDAMKQQQATFYPLQWLLDGCNKPLEDYAPKQEKTPKKKRAKKKSLPVWDMPRRMNLN